MALQFPEPTHSSRTQYASAVHQELHSMLMTSLPMSPLPSTNCDVIDSNFQALGEFLAEQPPLWGSVQVASSPRAWPLSPLSVAGFSSHSTRSLSGLAANARAYQDPTTMFGDQLLFSDCREIKQEPLIPMLMEWTPPSEPYYFTQTPSIPGPPIKRSSPVNYKEKLRSRQRGYEKVYRKKKRVEFKHMRREWIQLEMKHRMLRERMHSQAPAYLHKKAPSKLEALHELQLEERALRQDLVSLQSLKAWYDVSMVRLPVDKEGAILRTSHEWETVSDSLLGVSTTAPFAPLKMSFAW